MSVVDYAERIFKIEQLIHDELTILGLAKESPIESFGAFFGFLEKQEFGSLVLAQENVQAALCSSCVGPDKESEIKEAIDELNYAVCDGLVFLKRHHLRRELSKL